MKKFVFLLLCSIVFISVLPSFALDGKTPVLLFIGDGIENAEGYINEKIDLAPIKLPKKISHFELLETERALLPDVLKDQVGLWTSPLRTKYQDLKWLIPLSGVITALLLTDNEFSGVLTDNHNPSSTQKDISKAFSQIGGYYPTLSTPGGLFLLGVVTKNERLRETGILQYEGLGNAAIIGSVLQKIFGRNKPNNLKKGRGDFFEGSTSFPSGHSIAFWTLASVASHEYKDKKWVPIIAYSLATIVSASRLTQNIHFPSDVFAGALIGYLIGKYVVEHNSKTTHN